ncbi:MAG: ARMT1-like domain-containing protein [Lachnospiraceae bacterium]|nr:ARMT1-like domain-containing protein [Lachnospiraceae bacterium]
MRISEECAKCLYDRQKEKTGDPEYLAEIKALLDNRKDTDTSPYMVYLFNRIHTRHFGKGADYRAVKREYNDLVLSMEGDLKKEIEGAGDPLAKALMMARVGNYIDLGAMNHVDKETFLGLFRDTEMREDDERTYRSFVRECVEAESFLLICDNCGEIVLDKLMAEQLKKRFPILKIRAMVRGGEVLNDATMEDAEYTGLTGIAEVVSNGEAIAGTVYDMLPGEAKRAVDESDVILAKGQGNYESMAGPGMHAFYMFLCKCGLFTGRFRVPRLTGMFIEEGEGLT